MQIMSVSGEVVVRVDEVDVEQTRLHHPRSIEGFPPALQAMVAAFHTDEMQRFQRHMNLVTHTLEYVNADACDDGWLVKFKIREKRGWEMEAANA